LRYVEALTGATSPIDEPRWCGDGGVHLNLTPGSGLKRGWSCIPIGLVRFALLEMIRDDAASGSTILKDESS
jgi:hypothetical protein